MTATTTASNNNNITTNNSNDSSSGNNNYQNMDNYNVVDTVTSSGDIEATMLSPTHRAAAIVSPNIPPEPVVGKGLLKPIPELTILEGIAGTIGSILVILAIVAIVLEGGGAITTLAGIGSIVLGIYLYYQQTVLTDIRTLIETKLVLENEVIILQQSNEQFHNDISSLTNSVNELSTIRSTLQVLDTKYENSITEFETYVAKNQLIVKSMKGNYIGRILQNFISILMRNDTDKDSTVDPNEVIQLIQQIQPLIPDDMIFHDTEFRNAITGKSLPDVIQLIKSILNDISANNNSNNTIITTTTTTTDPTQTTTTSTDRGTTISLSSSRRIIEYRTVPTIAATQEGENKEEEQDTTTRNDDEPHLT